MDMEITSTSGKDDRKDPNDIRLNIINCEKDIIHYLPLRGEIQLCTSKDNKADIEEIDNLISISCEKIKLYETTKELNSDTQAALSELVYGIEETEEDLRADLTAANARFDRAKEDLDYVLKEYYPNFCEEIRTILKDLKEKSMADDEESKYCEVNLEMSIESLSILQNALCVIPHPNKPNWFKLAPLS